MALCGRAALLVEALRVGFAVPHAEGAAGARGEPQRAPLRWGHGRVKRPFASRARTAAR
jgi:hypothetical protein